MEIFKKFKTKPKRQSPPQFEAFLKYKFIHRHHASAYVYDYIRYKNLRALPILSDSEDIDRILYMYRTYNYTFRRVQWAYYRAYCASPLPYMPANSQYVYLQM